MKEIVNTKEQVKKYYDQEVKDYIEMYGDGYTGYPANLIRLNIITKLLKQKGIRTILDIGCGTGIPMIKLLKKGFRCKGFDFSQEMVNQGKIELKKAGFDSNLIFQADLVDGSNLPKEKFNAIIASGVFPHIENELKALSKIKRMLNRKGSVFIEFRNDLFAAFTLNNYSTDFFLNRVLELELFPKAVSNKIIKFYSQKLNVNKKTNKDRTKIQYTDILAKFHNPLTIEREIFKPSGFSINKIHFYHYHALPPIFEVEHPKLFKEISLKMEKPNDWKGHLMASAYVVEATKDD